MTTFWFCLDKAAEVVCIDLSLPQLALAELKWLALQELRQSGLLTLLGSTLLAVARFIINCVTALVQWPDNGGWKRKSYP